MIKKDIFIFSAIYIFFMLIVFIFFVSGEICCETTKITTKRFPVTDRPLTSGLRQHVNMQPDIMLHRQLLLLLLLKHPICQSNIFCLFIFIIAVAYLSLGDCLATTNRHAEAEFVLKKCLTLDGSRVKDIKSHVTAKKSCVLLLGRMFATIGKHQDAVKVFKSAIKSEGSSSRVSRFLHINAIYYL